ncbi:MAG: RNA polymerase sigma factor [Bacteroidota bacterium]
MSPKPSPYFQEVYEAHKERIYRMCRGFMASKDDAEDLFQEVMLIIWKKLPDFREEAQLGTWIYRITTNAALLALNREKRNRKLLEEVEAVSIELPQEDSLQEERLLRLRKLIAELKEIDRVVITLVLEGCQYQEISDITGLSMSHVGVRINRLKKQIKRKFETHAG